VYFPELIDSQRWIGIKSVLCIERWGEREGKAYPHKAYAISLVATSASQWQGIIRGHWGIGALKTVSIGPKTRFLVKMITLT
jgi:hypothetical protein